MKTFRSPSTGLRTSGGGLILLMISVHAEVLEAFLIVFQQRASGLTVPFCAGAHLDNTFTAARRKSDRTFQVRSFSTRGWFLQPPESLSSIRMVYRRR